MLCLLASLPLAGGLGGCGRERTEGPVGSVLPDLSFADLDGRLHRLAELREKPVLINVWASWCPPCRAEMAGLENLHRGLGGRVRVQGISADSDLNLAREYVRQTGLTFPVWSDPGGKVMAAVIKTPAIPASVLVAGDGRIRRVEIGERDWEKAPARSWVESLAT